MSEVGTRCPRCGFFYFTEKCPKCVGKAPVPEKKEKKEKEEKCVICRGPGEIFYNNKPYCLPHWREARKEKKEVVER
jgi:hypothetical protein